MKTTLLGGLSPQKFLAEYWQKKPLLVRGALPGFNGPLTREEVLDLACDEDAESRQVWQGPQGWQLEHGPFAARDFKRRGPWTVLVQGVNLFSDAADALLQTFDFLPASRLDDLMVSVATDGGGVGPHFDSYDVFLLQGVGQRRWRISDQRDLTLLPGAPLRILKNFRPTEEWVLGPGDMLYLPPHYAHDGVAIGECMTWSIGFRAPGTTELARGFLEFLSEQLDLPGRYSDPHLKLPTHRAQISAEMLDQVEAMIGQIQWDRALIRDFLGRYLTEPKPQVFFEGADETGGVMSGARFAKQLAKCGVRLHRKTQLLFSGTRFFINGEAVSVPAEDRKGMQVLANTRQAPADYPWSPAGINVLMEWHTAGFVVLPTAK